LRGDELAGKPREMIDLHYRTNRIALICSFLATESQSDFGRFIEKINARLPEDNRISIANLLTGLSNLSTAEPLIELWKLAAEARSNRELVASIVEADSANFFDACKRTPAGKEFAERLKAYLSRFAFIAANDEDLSCSRWADDPSFPITILKNYVQGDGIEDPTEAARRRRQCREDELKRTRSVVGLVRRPLFLSKLNMVTSYCRWREITRVPLSKTYYHCRRVFIELGKRLAARGVIDQPEDVFWLEREELIDLIDKKISSEDARRSIARARLISDCYRNFEPPATIGKGSRIKPERISSNGLLFTGVACSAGEVTARARVIKSLSEADRLARGEVLIAPHTNPGWTPLFSLAAAVVLEEGGLLSHGSVVARECG